MNSIDFGGENLQKPTSTKKIQKWEIVTASYDTDYDWLMDGDEIVMAKNSEGRVFFKMRSNPCLRDTDGDGLDDKEDDIRLLQQTIDFLGSEQHPEQARKEFCNEWEGV